MNFLLTRFSAGTLLMLLQILAALPWLAVLDPLLVRTSLRRPRAWAILLGIAVAGGLLLSLGLYVIQDPDTLIRAGRVYGALLFAQLVADLLVGFLAVLLVVWPKGGAVALAAFREGVRQPMFWLLTVLAIFWLAFVSPFVPYFTFGEDYKMMQEIGYDTIMLVGLLFAVLTASMSISEEIEGRTAITLMSKPLSRRQFLLGKFIGIFLAASAMTLILGFVFVWVLEYKHWYENMDPVPVPDVVIGLTRAAAWGGESADLVQGSGLWIYDAIEVLPGLVLGLCKVMVILAVSVSLATRLPMVANLVTCLVIYLLGHLTPILLYVAQHRFQLDAGGAVSQMLFFVAQVFETLLPGMEFFSLGPVLASDTPPPVGEYLFYVGSVILYGLTYTVVVLTAGLLLFEDRDLA